MVDGIAPQRSGYLEHEKRSYYYEYFGDGQCETICLLNGLAMSTRSWHSFLPLVQPEFDVLLFDYCGQGNSFSEDAPYHIPDFCHALTRILDRLNLEKIHAMGISYGGFVALEYARLYQERLHTMMLSGILLTHEELFEMYEEISLLFYRTRQMEIYAYYMYEKIFGETFVRKVGAKLREMRQKLVDRYTDMPHCLEQLTLAQDRLFGALDANLTGYKAIATPTLILAGADDRVIPPPVQKKICGILKNTRFEVVEDSGHVVYIEKPGIFFSMLKRFTHAKSLDFDNAGAPV